jgi:hypothetical protein
MSNNGLSAFPKKSRWDKLFSERSIRRAAESHMRPKEELDEIVQNIIKGQENAEFHQKS